MTKFNQIKLFEEKKVRAVYDDVEEKWYFSIVDVCGVLTESKDALTARKYWNKLKQRLKEEGNETVTNCHQLKLQAADGKMRKTDVATSLRPSVALYAKDGKIIKGKTFGCLPISHYLCNIYKESFRWYKTTSFSRH